MHICKQTYVNPDVNHVQKQLMDGDLDDKKMHFVLTPENKSNLSVKVPRGSLVH